MLCDWYNNSDIKNEKGESTKPPGGDLKIRCVNFTYHKVYEYEQVEKVKNELVNKIINIYQNYLEKGQLMFSIYSKYFIHSFWSEHCCNNRR
jgi:hypothetical protein